MPVNRFLFLTSMQINISVSLKFSEVIYNNLFLKDFLSILLQAHAIVDQ